ncbi:hypothetical protein ACRALDRAFT_1095007 [Sodiomyces alcalophilus JCM 7366]|uniref:uncharacterized protein n=1 Tax=Sodiomyces alcalophilus JCM 7366 TaxID=591952 RepID=UPI0039B366CB
MVRLFAWQSVNYELISPEALIGGSLKPDVHIRCRDTTTTSHAIETWSVPGSIYHYHGMALIRVLVLSLKRNDHTTKHVARPNTSYGGDGM